MIKSDQNESLEITGTQETEKKNEIKSVRPLEKASFTFGVFGRQYGLYIESGNDYTYDAWNSNSIQAVS